MSKRLFTLGELLPHDGRDGASAFVGVAGGVYDVSGSYHWRGGRHQVLHDAGRDLTRALEQAPHGADVLARYPIVGTLDRRHV